MDVKTDREFLCRAEETSPVGVASKVEVVRDQRDMNLFTLELALTPSERNVSRKVLDPTVYDEQGPASRSEAGRRGEEGGASGPKQEETSPREFARAEGAPDTGGTATKEVNQSLARIEMNSLEVKLFLDSIDQRISRMEPRLEEIRATETATGAVDAASASLGETEGSSAQQGGSPPVPGPTAERRRRAQGVPVERRRAPYAVATETEGEGEHSWGAPRFGESVQKGVKKVVALARRRWIPIAVVAALTLVMLLVLGSVNRAKPARVASISTTDAGPSPTDAGPLVAGRAASARQPKSSADVPWGVGADRGGTGRTAPGSPDRGGVVEHPVVEQGVVVPQPLSAPRPVVPVADSSVTAAPTVPADGHVGGTASSAPTLGAQEAPVEALPAPPTSSGRIVAPTPSAPSGRIVAPAYRRINVSSGVMAGNLLYSPQPAYPKGFAGLFHIQGEVVMQAIISKRGRVENLKVISGHMMLRGAAKDAVRTWRYRPYTVNGGPVEVATIVSVEFHK